VQQPPPYDPVDSVHDVQPTNDTVVTN
jgi:hypothetical protein